MASLTNIFNPGAGTRPTLACEIRPEGVVAARVSPIKGGSEIAMAFAALAEGALTPGLKVPNMDAAAVRTAVESAVGTVNARGRARTRALTVVVPDAAARVLLLDFDSLPAKRQEALPVVRFRLRKMVPFDVETAAVSYQPMGQTRDQLNVLVTVLPAEVLAEYENVVREAGYEPGAVLPSTLALAAGIATSGATLMVNQAGAFVTTAVTQGDEMLLHRSMDLPSDPAVREEEMAQAVITALAWYEDTLHSTPGSLYYAGSGGAAAATQARWMHLVGSAPQIAEFAVPEHATAMTTVPAGLTAGVMGALATP